jgi:putative nucleotidyltransferase with HDIG domain
MVVTNLVLIAAIGLLQAQPLSGILREAGRAAAYAPGAAVLGIGGILLLQRPFGITTHLGLLELGNPEMPLMRQLQTNAPGTYHHSLMVASLAEAAAEAIGADALLTRVGALYHDIGKLDRPAFFVENQTLLGVENVHDGLTCSLSSLIIIAHAKDGVSMAQRYRLPQEIRDIIAQHHGTTLVRYFYQLALSGERPESVTEDQFRYPGPLPDTKESALVMLADGVQAAVRAIETPTPHQVEQRVREIIRDRAVYGQLDRCNLTFRDLAVVEATMSRVLTAALIRNRIEYPDRAAVS